MPYATGASLNTQKLCLPRTRETLLSEIMDWLNNVKGDQSRVFWLHGPAGAGKSAIAHTIANHFNERRRLGSLFCFNRAERRHEKVITTIARDLADGNPLLRELLAAKVPNLKALLNTPDIQRQWKELIMKPAKVMMGPMAIVIDALDESGNPSSRHDLLEILAGRAPVNDLESCITELPPDVRILLTSRRLTDIESAFRGVMHVESRSMEDIASAKDDIRSYFVDQLKRVDLDGQKSAVIEALINQSSQIFEWARLASAYIKGDDNVGRGRRPLNRFEDITTHHEAKEAPLLDTMYLLTLKDLFPAETQWARKSDLTLFKSVMSIILGTMEPLSLATLESMTSHIADLKDVDIGEALSDIDSLLVGITDRFVPIQARHASFREFLMDRERSKEFFVDMNPEVHSNVASACLAVMKEKLQFNICNLPNSHLPNSKVPDLDERVKKHIPGELAYACQYWTEHVRATSLTPTLADKILEFLNHERLLFWFEALSLLRTMSTASRSFSSLMNSVTVCHFKGFCKNNSDC